MCCGLFSSRLCGGVGGSQSSPPPPLQIAKALWWYWFSKFIEFFDTFFFILRKKNSQVQSPWCVASPTDHLFLLQTSLPPPPPSLSFHMSPLLLQPPVFMCVHEHCSSQYFLFEIVRHISVCRVRGCELLFLTIIHIVQIGACSHFSHPLFSLPLLSPPLSPPLPSPPHFPPSPPPIHPSLLPILSPPLPLPFPPLPLFIPTLSPPLPLPSPPPQVTFLHVYHHASMAYLWWIGIKWVAGGQCKSHDRPVTCM